MQTLAGTANCKGVQIHNLAERMRKMYFGLEKEKDMMQVGGSSWGEW